MTTPPMCFALEFEASDLGARSNIRRITNRLETIGILPGQISTVQIVLAEAINNIVEHAYAGRAAGQIHMQCRLALDRLFIDLSDTGAALPDGQLPNGLPADVTGPRDTLPEGGFGWFLIHELARTAEYVRKDGCNHLHLSFDIPSPEA